MNDAIFRHVDPDEDQVAVFPARISGLGYNEGRGVNIRTTFRGCSIPDADIPRLIDALLTHLNGEG